MTVRAVVRTASDQRRLSSSNRPFGPATSDMTTLKAIGTMSSGTEASAQTTIATGTTASAGITNGSSPMTP